MDATDAQNHINFLLENPDGDVFDHVEGCAKGGGELVASWGPGRDRRP